jgi:hypothetical protein
MRAESDRRWRAEKKRLLAAGWLWYMLGGGAFRGPGTGADPVPL